MDGGREGCENKSHRFPPLYPAAGSATEGRLLSLIHFHAVHIPKMPYITSLIGVQ